MAGHMLTALPLLLASVLGTVSPSGESVPANLLRIELRFDQPLPALPLRHIVLHGADGAPIDGALLDLSLAGKDERSLVLLMHPGRVKQGLGAAQALGRALHEGDQVSITIDDPRLAKPLRHAWRVGPAIGERIDPARWSLQAPPAGARAPLVLKLPAPLNASAAELIAIAGPGERRIAGRATWHTGETEWRFIPAAPWRAGAYRVRLHPDLEDPAGNRLCAPFEERQQSARDCTEGAAIGFRIVSIKEN
jgi:hypothetical protein